MIKDRLTGFYVLPEILLGFWFPFSPHEFAHPFGNLQSFVQDFVDDPRYWHLDIIDD